MAHAGRLHVFMCAKCRRSARRNGAPNEPAPVRLTFDLVRNRDGGPHRDTFEELLRHEPRHSDAAVARRISGEEALVHANPTYDPHEKRHGGSVELGPLRHLVLPAIDVLLDDFAGARVDVVSIQAGEMIPVLLLDLEIACGGVEALATSGNGADAH